jgi:membrane-bound serine protease (ClpP class)
MDPLVILCLLIAAALLLIVIEAFLPTHGVLGGVGVLLLIVAIAVGFTINTATGASVFAGSAIATPLLTILVLKTWQRSPIGRRITLNATTQPLEHEQIRVGDVGTTVSALRPMGEAEFGPVTVQVAAHTGSIDAGKRIKVIAYRDGIATVEVL